MCISFSEVMLRLRLRLVFFDIVSALTELSLVHQLLLLGHFSDFCLSISLALNGRGSVRDLLVGGLRDSIEQFLIYYIFLIFSCYSSLGPKREHFSGHLTPEGTFILSRGPILISRDLQLLGWDRTAIWS